MRRRRRLPRPTDRIRVGRTGLRVSPLCLGMIDSSRVVHDAFEAGINFFFLSADMHWPYYESLRRGLRSLLASRRGIRDEIVIAAACYPAPVEFNTFPFREIVEFAPWLERIDIGVMGGAYGSDMLNRLPTYVAHRRARWVGMRAVGATFHDRVVIPAAVNHGLVDIAFGRYNPDHPGARLDVFPHFDPARRVPFFNFKSVAGVGSSSELDRLGLPPDSWRPTISDYYRFALTPPEVDGILCAPANGRELQALLDALARGPLSASEDTYLVNLSRLIAGELELERESSSPSARGRR